MGKISEFSINLYSPRPVYYPGQEISGYVTLNLKDYMKMTGLRVTLTGKAKSHWTEIQGTGDDRHEDSYSGKQTIIKQSTCLFGSPVASGHQKYSHPPGKMTYAFSFTLPTQLPSSLEGNHGFIRYMLQAKLNRPWKFNSKAKHPITVNDLIDTNHPMYAAGKGDEKQKKVGCLCCKAGSVDMSASVDRSCYCPGEAILINVNVANKTTRNMTSLHARLVQTVTYYAKLDNDTTTDLPVQKTRKITNEITKLSGPPIPKGEFATWHNQPFGIPAVPPTITNCTIITVHYEVQVIVGVPWGVDPVINMTIVIGTIPHIATYGQPVVYGTREDEQEPPQGHLTGVPAQPSVFGYPDMPPPGYSTVVGAQDMYIGNERDEYTYGDLQYNPVYTFAQPYQ